MEKTDMIQRMEAAEFRKNNGKVLRTINILYEKYVKLSTLRYALPEIPASEIRKSVNYLELEDYIKIRTVEEKQTASISDFELDDLEAKLSGKGIKLLSGSISDKDIDV